MNHRTKSTFEPLARAAVLPAVALTLIGCGDSYDSADGPIDEAAEQQIAVEIDLAGQSRVQLRNRTGTVRLRGTDDGSTLRILATKRVESWDPDVAQDHLSTIDVLTEESPAMVTITTHHPESEQGLRYRVDYSVSLPHSMAAEVFNDVGDIWISAVGGGLFLSSGAGDVTLYEVQSDVSVLADDGDIAATLDVPRHGVVDLGTRTGQVDLTIPEDTSAELMAVASDGKVEISNLEMTESSKAEDSWLSATLGAGDGYIALWSLAGDIELVGY